MKIPGLSLTDEECKNINSQFSTWADHFTKLLYSQGMVWLISQYETVVTTCELETCHHGPNGTALRGEAFRDCCGISYEYMNDISCRYALQIIIDSVSDLEKARIQGLISELDQRLKALLDKNPEIYRDTEMAEKPKDIFWWHYKLPVTIRP